VSPHATRFARLAFLVCLAVYGVASLRTPDAGRLLDSVDLAIHETGHLVFAPFGELIGFFGGTLLQLLFPAVFVAYFLRRGERYGAAMCLWWVAQNCWNVSVYVADARAQELPLVGGGEHDWAYLLGETGWLAHDATIATAIHATGVLILVVALALGFLAALATPAAEANDARRSRSRPSPPSTTSSQRRARRP
jgi:hypothetical protein